MSLKKPDDEKAQQRADRDAEAYAASPLGRAEAAYRRGDWFFQVEIDVQPVTTNLLSRLVVSALTSVLPNRTPREPDTPPSTDVLGDIERAGWHLEHVGYVYVQTGSSSSGDSSSCNTTYSGKSVGIYLFRRVSSPT